jgi:hypothetical protein
MEAGNLLVGGLKSVPNVKLSTGWLKSYPNVKWVIKAGKLSTGWLK